MVDTVSGTVVTTTGRSFVDSEGIMNTEELNRLAHNVLKTIEQVADKLNRNGRSADPVGH